MANVPTLTEADIMAEVVAPDQADLSPETAHSFLSLRFGKEATQRVRRLLRKNNSGKITADERETLEKYLRVGQFIDLLRAKAKQSLRRSKAD